MALISHVKLTAWCFRHMNFTFQWRSCISANNKVYLNRIMFNAEPKTAYFKQEDNGLSVSVFVEQPELGIKKNIIVCKVLETPLCELLKRMNLKIFSELEKHAKKRAKKNLEEIVLPEIKSVLYYDNKPLTSTFSCKNVFELDGKLQLEILGDTYSVVCNAPWVNKVGLPKQIKSDMVISPQRFECSYAEKDKSSFLWYRSDDEKADKKNPIHIKNWKQVGNGFFYRVKDSDVGHYLKLTCIPRNGVTTGPEFVEISQSLVEATHCCYYYKETHELTKEKAGNNKMRIVTYNVLADMYASTKEGKVMFEYCPAPALARDQRMSAICCELAGYNSDIVCLQEVEGFTYQNYFQLQMEELGFTGLYSLKGNDREGTACFFNKEKFRYICSQQFVYGQLISVNPFLKTILSYINQNNNFYEKFANLPHTLQLAALETLDESNRIVVVGNVHLYSSPEADLIRLLQFMCSVCLFQSFKEELLKMLPGKKISFIICGDFNSTPECSIHELVTTGSLSSDHNIWQTEEINSGNGMTFTLPVKMDSACGTPKYTNYTRQFKGCLDYIYYETSELKVDRTYPIPDEDVLSAHVGLPSIKFPSDHIPLIADLEWKTL